MVTEVTPAVPTGPAVAEQLKTPSAQLCRPVRTCREACSKLWRSDWRGESPRARGVSAGWDSGLNQQKCSDCHVAVIAREHLTEIQSSCVGWKGRRVKIKMCLIFHPGAV
ncbi:hypothetical protein KIL84_018416 [Mauremys mutica]|uniref:Uncharacterized protein n=1 Tax=Mauremys mutica TaxID=74926 RepID=A0A9D4B2E5_9SAUR|nr:hypothetical protein KIL84_018416 [Mauremys mutica]